MSKIVGIALGGLAALTGIGLIADAAFFAGAGVAALGLTTTGALGIAATAGLIGAEFVLSRPRPNAPQLPTLSQPPLPLRQTIKQSNAPRLRTYGRVRHGGVYFVYESDAAKNLFFAIYLCDGPIDGFDAILCDDEAFGMLQCSNTFVTGDPPCNVYLPNSGIKSVNPAYGNYLSSLTYGAYIAFEPVNACLQGYSSLLFTQLAPLFNSVFSGMWGSGHLGQGITCLYTYANTNATNGDRIKYFPNGYPLYNVVYRGCRVYDPRDPTQSFLNPSTGQYDLYNPTWKWSENPALIAADYVNWLIQQGLSAMTGVNWADIATAANLCDALVSATRTIFGNGSAQEPFARITAMIPYDTAPRDALGNIMAACDGGYSIDGAGRFTMYINQWETPSVVFSEEDIGGFTEDFAESTTDAINEVASTYIEPRMSYAKYAAPTYYDEVSQAQVGKRVSSIDYLYVPSPNQAYRLTQRHVKRTNGKRKISLTLGPRGILALRQRVIGFNTPDYGLPAVCRVEQLQPSANLASWTAVVREVTQDVYADTPPPIDPVAALYIINAPSLSAPQTVDIGSVHDASNPGTGYVVLSLDVNLNNPQQSIPGLTLTAVTQDQTLEMDGQWSLDDTTWTPFTITLTQWGLRGPNLPIGATVYAQARFISLNGTTGPWSSSVSVTI
jgi:hypothetical protein